MKTFQICRRSKQTSEYHIRAQVGKIKQNRKIYKLRREKDKIHKVAYYYKNFVLNSVFCACAADNHAG